MRCIVKRNVVVLLAVIIIPAHLRGGEPEARSIVERTVKASGWDKDDKPGALTWKDKGIFNFMGNKLDYDADWIFQPPGKYRFDLRMEVGGMKIEMKMGTDGTKAFEAAMGMERQIEGDKLDYVKGQSYRMWVSSLTPLLKDKEFKLKSLGESKVNNKPALGVQVDREGKQPVKLFFSKDTGLLAKVEGKVKNEFANWAEAVDEAYYEDWKDIDGIKAFTKLRVVRNGELLLESTLTDYRRVAPVDAAKFERP